MIKTYNIFKYKILIKLVIDNILYKYYNYVYFLSKMSKINPEF